MTPSADDDDPPDRLGRPLVSVIIPCYNYAHFLEGSVGSLRAQSLDAWECVVVDYGSTDDTAAVVAGLGASDQRIRYVSQPHSGLATARNTGLAATSAPFVQFLDADDMIGPRKLAEHTSFLSSHTDAVVVYGPSYHFSAADEGSLPSNATKIDWAPVIRGDDPVMALLGRPFPVHAALVRRSAALEIGGFDAELHFCEDWDFWIRLALRGYRFCFEGGAEAAAYYRTHAASMVANRRAMLLGHRVVRRRFDGILPAGEARAYNRRQLRDVEGQLVLVAISEGRRVEALGHCLRAAVLSPRGREALKWVLAAACLPTATEDSFKDRLARPLFGRKAT